MASWNEITPDPDTRELADMAGRAKEVSADSESPDDNLTKPASADDYKTTQLDASDLMDDLTSSFDGEIAAASVNAVQAETLS
jgi:hypothetical protein